MVEAINGLTRRFVWLAAILAVYRLSLLGRGAMAFLDETLYFKAAQALQQLVHLDVVGALRDIAFSNGRPGMTVLMMPAAALQAIPFAFGIPPSNPISLLIPTACNVVVSLLTLYLFFRVCLVLSHSDQVVATAGAAVYGLLVNTNLYIRHVLPYDWALGAATYAIWLAVSKPNTPRRALAIGLLAALVVLTYPGYYLLAAVVGIVVIGADRVSESSRRWLHAACFIAGAVVVIAAFEVGGRLGGRSYLESARTLSRTITQGSFEEGWTFLPAYLLQVERGAGVMLLGAVAMYVCRLLVALRHRRRLTTLDWLMMPAIVAWMWQAITSYHLHALVLYGRLIHPWMMFAAWALVDALAAIRQANVRVTCAIAAVAVSVLSLGTAAYQYYRVAYPADVLYALGINTARLPPDRMRCELDAGYSYSSPSPLNRQTGYPYKELPNLLLVNFCQGAPASGNPHRANVQAAATLYQSPHFMTFAAYGFEGLTPGQRREIRAGGYDVAAYEVR